MVRAFLLQQRHEVDNHKFRAASGNAIYARVKADYTDKWKLIGPEIKMNSRVSGCQSEGRTNLSIRRADDWLLSKRHSARHFDPLPVHPSSPVGEKRYNHRPHVIRPVIAPKSVISAPCRSLSERCRGLACPGERVRSSPTERACSILCRPEVGRYPSQHH